MILNSENCRKVEQLFNHGEMKIGLGCLALVNTKFSSVKMEFLSLFLKQFSGEFNEKNFEKQSFA